MFIIDQNFKLDSDIAWDTVTAVEFRLGADITNHDQWTALDLFLHNSVESKKLIISNDVNSNVNLIHRIGLFSKLGWAHKVKLDLYHIICTSLSDFESVAAIVQLSLNHLDFEEINVHMIVSHTLGARAQIRKDHQWQPLDVTQFNPGNILTQRIDLLDIDADYDGRNLDCGSFDQAALDVDAGIITV